MYAFIRYISHELRTPLNTMHIGIELLKNSMAANQIIDAHEIIADIFNSCRMTECTLDNLLTYNAIKSNTLSLNLSNVNIWKYLRSMVKQFPKKVLYYVYINNHIYTYVFNYVYTVLYSLIVV
jgi:K+-sensing histidine kinase KdpD